MIQASAANPESASDTRQRLLLTALHLYSREGLHGVSLRRISAVAGSRNSAAMHYHFDNKQGVLRALVELIADELSAIDTRLRASAAPPRTLREACFHTLRPLARLPAEQIWGADALRFMSRMAGDGNPQIAAVINRVYEPFWRRTDRSLAGLLPDLPAATRQLRLMFMSVNVFHGFAEVGSLAHTPLGDLSHFDEEVLLNHLVDYLLGGLQAPSHEQSWANYPQKSP